MTHIHHIESIEQQVLFDGQIEGSVSAETRTVVDLYENWSEVWLDHYVEAQHFKTNTIPFLLNVTQIAISLAQFLIGWQNGLYDNRVNMLL